LKLFKQKKFILDIKNKNVSGLYMENWAIIDDDNFFVAKLISNIISLCVAVFFFIPLRFP